MLMHKKNETSSRERSAGEKWGRLALSKTKEGEIFVTMRASPTPQVAKLIVAAV